MKEINYRAWDLKNKKMIYGFEKHRDWILTTYYSTKDVEKNDSGYIPMQFIGLCDRNGEKIYHHDIFRSDKGKLFEVVWSNKKHGWAVYYIGTVEHNPYKSMNWAIENGEVVGNIYERTKYTQQQ